jgi:hypothetical protein
MSESKILGLSEIVGKAAVKSIYSGILSYFSRKVLRGTAATG